MLLLCQRLLTNSRFVRYPNWLKDEMTQEGCVKILKNLKNMKEEYRKSFFAYWTLAATSAFMVVLAKYYKEQNLKKELLM